MLVCPAGTPEQLSEVPSTSQPELLSEAVPAAAGSLDGDSEEAVRFYNPYEGLSRALDSRGSIKGTYKLPQHPEFLFSEEATVHRRSWTENLTYYTGTGYLSGEVSPGCLAVPCCPVHAGALAQVPGALCVRHHRAIPDTLLKTCHDLAHYIHRLVCLHCSKQTHPAPAPRACLQPAQLKWLPA